MIYVAYRHLATEAISLLLLNRTQRISGAGLAAFVYLYIPKEQIQICPMQKNFFYTTSSGRLIAAGEAILPKTMFDSDLEPSRISLHHR